MRKTKIICTIGPATSSYEMLEQMAQAGMNVVRLNMSHGDHKTHEAVIRSVQQLNQTLAQPISLMLDTQGPEIRTSDLTADVQLTEGSVISVSVRGQASVEESSFQINYDDLLKDVVIGDRITVDNGLINLEVLEKNAGMMRCMVIDGGLLKSKRHVNLPGIKVNIPCITPKDIQDIKFGMEHDVDFIALSFTREANDIALLRELLAEKSNKIKIIAKIEDQEGVKNIAEIIDACDGIMVARGDLGVEIKIHELPNVQREIVRLCAKRGKRVIVATHLLESMIQNPIPTRAEVTDVANAVYEEVDAVMLSGETTVGKYPIKCVEYLNNIAIESEKQIGLKFSDQLVARSDKQYLAKAAVILAESVGAKGIVVITRHGRMANYVTNCHPQTCVIYAFTNDVKTQRQMSLNRNVKAFDIEFSQMAEETLTRAFAILLNCSECVEGDKVIVISDVLQGGNVDAIQLRTL